MDTVLDATAWAFWTATACLVYVLLFVVRRCVAGCVRQAHIWWCWSKLPHTSSSWSLGGDLDSHRAIRKHLSYAQWAKELGGAPLGLRLAYIPVCVWT